MIPLLFILTSSIVFGFAILETFEIALNSIVSYLLALTIGISLNTLLIFLLANFFGLNLLLILICCSVTALPSFFILINKSPQLNFLKSLNLRKNFIETVGFFLIFFVISLLFINSIFEDVHGIVAGNRLVWTDWPVHIALISSFSLGNNFPPQNPLYSGPNITYPFLSDFFSAILKNVGISLKYSLVIPGILFTTVSLGLIYYFGLILTGNKKTSLVGLFIGIFWGGLGFYYFFQDILNSPSKLQTLLLPPHEYTFYAEKNLWFFSFLYSEMLPQRGFLFGLPMFFTAAILLVLGISHGKKKYLLLSAIIAGIMPFFHLHSLLSFLIFSFSFIVINFLSPISQLEKPDLKKQIRENILYFIAPLSLLVSVQMPFFHSTNISQSFAFNFGWMKGNESFFIFWLKNSGIFIPMFILAILKLQLKPLAKNIFLGAIVLFLIPNFFRLAPWTYDNLKVLTYWYLISAFAVASAAVWIFKKNTLGKLMAIIIVTSLMLTGSIEVLRVLNAKNTKINLWSANDIETATVVIQKTKPNSLILTAATHDNPISALAGRRIVIGFPGNAWSWGFSDWQQRELDVKAALKGDPFFTPQIINKYNVDYVFIGDKERYFEPLSNEQYFIKNYTLIAKGENYSLFKIR